MLTQRCCSVEKVASTLWQHCMLHVGVMNTNGQMEAAGWRQRYSLPSRSCTRYGACAAQKKFTSTLSWLKKSRKKGRERIVREEGVNATQQTHNKCEPTSKWSLSRTHASTEKSQHDFIYCNMPPYINARLNEYMNIKKQKKQGRRIETCVCDINDIW